MRDKGKLPFSIRRVVDCLEQAICDSYVLPVVRGLGPCFSTGIRVNIRPPVEQLDALVDRGYLRVTRLTTDDHREWCVYLLASDGRADSLVFDSAIKTLAIIEQQGQEGAKAQTEDPVPVQEVLNPYANNPYDRGAVGMPDQKMAVHPLTSDLAMRVLKEQRDTALLEVERLRSEVAALTEQLQSC